MEELNEYITHKLLIIVLIFSITLFYMEIYYLPHFLPTLYFGGGLDSYDLTLRNEVTGRYIHLQGLVWFMLSILGGRSLIQLLESLKGDSDNMGCISAKGEVKGK